jgi:uncharacterized membrane protein YccF (DUF307 family)
MSMSLIGNIIWLVFGGLPAALGYLAGGLAMCVTIVGIPWGLMSFKLALDVLMPFGRSVEPRQRGTGCLSVLFSIVWIVFVGWWLALGHVILGVLFTITIIGIPFGQQHFKLVWLALDPFGYELV